MITDYISASRYIIIKCDNSHEFDLKIDALLLFTVKSSSVLCEHSKRETEKHYNWQRGLDEDKT